MNRLNEKMKTYEIMSKKRLAPNVNEYVVYAPLVAKHCLAGQFVILRVDSDGERVPFTICDYSRENGTVSIMVQEVGYTTAKLALLDEGDALCDFVGPLGNPTDLSAYENICLVGGGIGSLEDVDRLLNAGRRHRFGGHLSASEATFCKQ